MTSLFTNSEQTLSYGESRDDDVFRKFAGSRDGIAADASEVIAVGADDLLDEAEVAQAFEITGDAGGGQVRQVRFGCRSTVDNKINGL